MVSKWNNMTVFHEGDVFQFDIGFCIRFDDVVQIEEEPFVKLLKSFITDFVKSYFNNLCGDCFHIEKGETL